jgi:phage shock protein PspC (stress-responsive transcriptional regulator)
MNKVTIINLNGKAYQLEESGYTLLRDYLDEAERKLASNPDKNEIIADFEQAIAEKADKRLNFQKTVVTEAEVKGIIEEMGPVEGETVHDETHRTEDAAPPAAPTASPKRFYRIREGKVLGGVCTGLAAYFNIDVVIVRIIVILLTLLTHGFMVMAYIITVLIVPMADTDEKLAAAYGVPFTAQDLMDRAKTEYGDAKQSWRAWRKNRKRQWRENIRRERREAYPLYHSAGSILLQTIFALITAGLTIAWILGLITLFTMGGIFGIIWAGMPIWIVAILFTIFYGIIVSPFHEHRYSYSHDGHHYCGRRHGGGFVSLLFVIFILWLIYHFAPDSHPVFIQVGDAFRHAWEGLRQAFGG